MRLSVFDASFGAELKIALTFSSEMSSSIFTGRVDGAVFRVGVPAISCLQNRYNKFRLLMFRIDKNLRL